jgi:hypothetical protein
MIPSVDPTPEDLDLYRLRDDLARHYKPCGSFETTLVGSAALALMRVRQAREIERAYRASHDMLDVFRTNPKEFQAVTRFLTRAEHALHFAIQTLERVQKLRKQGLPDLP